MRYLSSISLALIVHVLLSIGVLMALACTATPRPTPTPTGPMYSEEEAIAVVKARLQTKIIQSLGTPCWVAFDSAPSGWSAKYDSTVRRWNVTGQANEIIRNGFAARNGTPLKPFTWAVYEQTGSVVATGHGQGYNGETLNQVC